MERESFEDPAVAELMNEHFVPVKVDREERPDVDAIYMDAVQAMTGHGGWPLNAFLTPDGVPFYAGTYFPPEPRQGMPSWRMVLEGVARAWDEQRDDIIDGAERIVGRLQATAQLQAPDAELDPASLDAAVTALRRGYDAEHGGWGGAPKFPAASAIEFLLRRGERQMALHTLRRMACGGIYDQVGGGFARYSVDARWVVPHFEKMLYDNALLARAYLHAFQVSDEPFFERVCRETLDWALRELRQDEGGFASALDADSEGVEGKFYVWRLDEVREALGRAGRRRDRALRHDRGRQLRGRQHPGARDRRPGAARRDQGRPAGRPRAARAAGLDDKRLTAWNALMISALADAGAVLGEPRYRDAAVAAAEFVLRDLRDGDGRLLRTYNQGRAHLNAYLEDHAFLLEALLTLYEATFDPRWFAEAHALADIHPRPLRRPRAGRVLLHRGRSRGADRAPQGPRGHADPVRLLGGRLRPAAAGPADRRGALRGRRARPHPAAAHDRAAAPGRVRAPAVGDRLPARRGARGRARRRRSRAAGAGRARDVPPARRAGRRTGGRRAAARGARAGRRRAAAAYVCERFACRRPVTEPDELRALLE